MFLLNVKLFFAQDDCACDEKEMAFSQQYVNSQELIFRGKTIGVTQGTDYDKATFLIIQLFKGTAAQQMDVYFETKNNCSLKFTVGEDWLIYANYKQGKALAVYCSRCRKNIINTNRNVDLMYVKSDISIDDETDELQKILGQQKFSQQITKDTAHNNIIPNFWQRILLIIFSALGLVVMYVLLNKFLKNH